MTTLTSYFPSHPAGGKGDGDSADELRCEMPTAEQPAQLEAEREEFGMPPKHKGTPKLTEDQYEALRARYRQMGIIVDADIPKLSSRNPTRSTLQS